MAEQDIKGTITHPALTGTGDLNFKIDLPVSGATTSGTITSLLGAIKIQSAGPGTQPGPNELAVVTYTHESPGNTAAAATVHYGPGQPVVGSIGGSYPMSYKSGYLITLK